MPRHQSMPICVAILIAMVVGVVLFLRARDGAVPSGLAREIWTLREAVPHDQIDLSEVLSRRIRIGDEKQVVVAMLKSQGFEVGPHPSRAGSDEIYALAKMTRLGDLGYDQALIFITFSDERVVALRGRLSLRTI